MSTTRVEKLTLFPRRWVLVPDTDVQLALPWKWWDRSRDGTIEIARTGHPDPRWAGWDVRPVEGLAQARRVRS